MIQSADKASDTVFVSPPTGERETDRANIQKTFDAVQPGGIVQFAAGTYLVGKIIPLEKPKLTILGHSDGTILRGCDPDDYKWMEGEVKTAGDDQWARMSARLKCGVFELTGGQGTIRGLTIEYSWVGLALGAGNSDYTDFNLRPGRVTEGGYRVENNLFRNSANGVRPGYLSAGPTVIRGNRFMNLGHAISGASAEIHVLNNEISVPDADYLLSPGGPRFAIGISGAQECFIEGNRIDDHPSGIILFSTSHRASRHNVIRNNIIRGVRFPIIIWGEEDIENFVIEDNLIERNQITDVAGLGIALNRTSGNRIHDNVITGMKIPDPSLDLPFELGDTNGSGIWLSSGSNRNEIVNNKFKDIASSAVFIEGGGSRVEVQKTGDIVRDLGAGNRVIDPEVEPNDPRYEEKFIEAGGVRLHYLDFGGNGLPLVLVHSEGWDAYTYAEFAPRFINTNRVLSITRPGYGKSLALTEVFRVADQAESLIAFLDALGIERALFAGNSSPITYLTYLVEHHPERIADVIYLAGLMPMWLNDVQNSDPAGSGTMVELARSSDSVSLNRSRIIDSYRPEFLSDQNPPIDVPALAFAGRSGLIGYENFSWPLALVGSPLLRDFYADLPPSPATDYLRHLADDTEFRDESLAKIKDSSARAFFTLLAHDPEQQDEIWQYQQEIIGPALIEGQENFRRAFGTHLQLVPLDVSVIYGYEYRDAPELIEPHIRNFLEMIPFNKK